MGKEKNHRKGARVKKIEGDQNVMSGEVLSGGISFQGGHGNAVTIHQYKGPDAKELAALFEMIYQHIEARPPDPNMEKEEIVETVHKIEAEASKGEDANQAKLGRWMDNLDQMAPDIIDVILASLGGPVSGITAVLKKIADHAHQQSKA